MTMTLRHYAAGELIDEEHLDDDTGGLQYLQAEEVSLLRLTQIANRLEQAAVPSASKSVAAVRVVEVVTDRRSRFSAGTSRRPG